ncbi:putative glycogenin glucosyltransferase [Helianthus anomalus]
MLLLTLKNIQFCCFLNFDCIANLRLRWSVPCGPNSVITFPGASWLKPMYWWSWPVLPLGIQWHEQRTVFGSIFFIRHMYDSEMPFVLIQTMIYLCIIAVTRLARPTLTKLCFRGYSHIIHIISYMPISRDCLK